MRAMLTILVGILMLPVPAHADVPSWLDRAVEPGQVYSKRAIPLGGGVSIQATGADHVRSHPIDSPKPVAVLEEGGARVRVMLESEKARVALYVARDHLATVTLGGARLSPAPAVGEVGIDLPAGLIPTLGRRGAGWAVAHVTTRDLDMDGYLPEPALGPIFTPTGKPVDSGDDQGVVIKRHAALYASPGGRVLAKLRTGDDSYADVMRRRRDWALIRLVLDSGAVAVAWARGRDVRVPDEIEGGLTGDEYGEASGGFCFCVIPNEVRLPAGTLLRDRHARVVGVLMTDQVQVAIRRSPDGRPWISLSTDLGEVELEADWRPLPALDGGVGS